jgi:hypothetical protein
MFSTFLFRRTWVSWGEFNINIFFCPFASKHIEKLQTNINGYELFDYKYPLTAICIQAQTANIFARLFTFETGRLPLETEMFHRSCDVSHWKALSYFWRNCHVLMCLHARFNISKPIIICSSHKKYEYKQVWSLLQYRELGYTETYTKAHQNIKNNWIRPLNYNTSHEQWNIPFPTVNVTFQT